VFTTRTEYTDYNIITYLNIVLVSVDGVCTVFGDPHYRTYDGKFFSFQGPCKYLLSADCVGRTFSIRVTNDARNTKNSAWTKTISLRVIIVIYYCVITLITMVFCENFVSKVTVYLSKKIIIM